MKYSIVFKFLAITMASVCIMAIVGCAAGIVALESAGLYVNSLDALQGHAYNSIAREVAYDYVNLFAVENLGDLPYKLKNEMYADPSDRSDAEHWYATIHLNGELLDDEGKNRGEIAYTKDFSISPIYIIASLYSPEDMIPPSTSTPGTDPTETPEGGMEPRGPDIPELVVPPDYLYYTQETIMQNGRMVNYYLYHYEAPEYTVTVHLRERALESSSIYLLNTIYPHRHSFIWVLAASILTVAICLVYLVNVAGCDRTGNVVPGGLNRIPLDVSTLLTAGMIYVLALLLQYLGAWTDREGPHVGNLSLMGVNILALALVAVAWIFSLAAQIKMGGGRWWRHSGLGRLLNLLGRAYGAVRGMIPVMWHWMVTAAIMAVTTLAVYLVMINSFPGTLSRYLWNGIFLLVLMLCVAAVLYGGYCYGVLLKGTQQMRRSELGHKIPTKFLRGNFRALAEELNSLSDAALLAAQKQMRSERMKSELITNVSHDIKTPLTSIINFVDLLQRPHTEQQQRDYLSVLARQSGQMKKLIEDLMELSKASSGSITVNLQAMDAAEAVSQALGEFSDKLEAAGLTPVFQYPEESMMIRADGRLSWRVLSNLLNNAVKYALPGTRLYVDLVKVEDTVLLSVKNVSREPLTSSAEELLERFVQGDASRSTEGSGLGLNIAKSLMEVQGGQLQLMLDGDLFKATLVFPAEL